MPFNRGGSGNEELKKCPPPSSAVLWFVNVRDRKPRQNNKKHLILHVSNLLPSLIWFKGQCPGADNLLVTSSAGINWCCISISIKSHQTCDFIKY